MPLIATRGAASAQGFGEFAQTTAPVYIEDVFSTYLYTGTGATQTITNNIDLSTKGGLVWIKNRTTATDNALFDTLRGTNNQLVSNKTQIAASFANSLTAFNSNGFSLGSDTAGGCVNFDVGNNYVSWTFREQPKFFDIVTYTGNGSNRTISHNLGSVPGCMIIKRTDTTGNWATYHRSLGNETRLYLNTTDASVSGTSIWQSTTPTSTEFYVDNNSNVNANGGTYVAYLFAHNAGGFGLTGSDNVISCGSFTPSSLRADVNLGWEPQWLLVKRANSVSNWMIYDTMRGWVNGTTYDASDDQLLIPNLSSAEALNAYGMPTATGFTAYSNNDLHIYIAIRRGPMKTPTSGTSVYGAVAYTGNGTNQTLSPGFVTDLAFFKGRNESTYGTRWYDRLRGSSLTLISSSTTSESDDGYVTMGFMNGFKVSTFADSINGSSYTYVTQMFRRAPGFFDEVCYTGTGVNSTSFNHNLTVTPELVIIKRRDVAGGWLTNSRQLLGDNFLTINSTNAASFGAYLISNTATTFTVSDGQPNASGNTYVAYLFASLSGVSKVGSYTGTGALQTVNCGFTTGARFVLIKRSDSSGDWWVYDSTRGISSGNDPYLFLNSTAAQVTGTNYVDTTSVGFQVTAAAPAGLNANGGTYIFLAIA